MDYQGYTTFKVETNKVVLTFTFDYPPVNVQGIPIWNDAVIGIQEIK